MSVIDYSWTAKQPFYDSRALGRDGDDVERLGARSYSLTATFPNYERFWRYHVATATQRPEHALHFLPGVHESVIAVVQRSYTVFSYLVEAHEYLAKLQARAFGPRYQNWYNTLLYAGNAIQVFEGLQRAVENKVGAALGKSIVLFPDWEMAWKPSRERVINTRNYATHKGVFQVFVDPDSMQPFVLKRSEVNRTNLDDVSWTHSVADFAKHRSRFVECQVAGQEIVDETVGWLDRAYGRICENLDPFLATSQYRALWGWPSYHASVASNRPAATNAHSPSSNVGVSGEYFLPLNMCGTTSPPPNSGNKPQPGTY